MTYNASYDTADFQSIVIDGLGTAGAATVSWVSLLVLLLILGVVVTLLVKVRHAFK